MTVHCRVCHHGWELQFKLPIPLTRFMKAVDGFIAAGCPKCGATGEHVLCGPPLERDATLTTKD